MKTYEVKFKKMFDESGNGSDYPTDSLHTKIICDPEFVDMIPPAEAHVHPKNSLEDHADCEIWKYEVADDDADAFERALNAAVDVISYEEIPDPLIYFSSARSTNEYKPITHLVLASKRHEAAHKDSVHVSASWTDWGRDAWEHDKNGLAWAIERAREGKQVYFSEDEEGWYFAYETSSTVEPFTLSDDAGSYTCEECSATEQQRLDEESNGTEEHYAD